MNTPTLISLILFCIGLVWITFYTIGKYRRSTNIYERRLYVAYLVLYAFIFVGTVITGLNSYGIARLPLLNEVRTKLPESFTPADRPINPSTNGQTQPPSQPYFEDHKKLMEKLKRDGL